jgi:3-deoxy-D-manno-octulosonic-acid transferase
MNLRKIKKQIDGQKGLLDRIEAACCGVDGIIWFHVASLGEFEEARPVIEATRDRFPKARILLTFFSPNGYEARKNWPMVDWVFYLPFDTRRNMRRFFDAVRPSKAIFTIGELWPNMMREIRKRGIDASIMSVRTEPDSSLFGWLGAGRRKIFRTSYRHVLVQNERSKELLEGIGVPHVIKVGDARVDRVLKIAAEPWNNAVVDQWCGGEKVLVAGCTSTVEDDDFVIAIANAHTDKKIMVVPKEMDPEPMQRMISAVNGRGALYSGFENGEPGIEKVQVLIVDKVGMLAQLYRYGYAAIVGGGFAFMPHSVIEPAVYGLPVLFGPKYQRETHCVDMVELGAGTPVNNPQEALQWFETVTQNPQELQRQSKIASAYCRSNAGATDAIMLIIFG